VKAERGIIQIDGHGRTNVKGVWAIGDVTPARGWRTRPATKA
jgi:dihydrolipoamide dehydrogenase